MTPRALACRAALAAALAAAPALAGAGWFSSFDAVAEPRRLFDAGKYGEVIARLSPEAIQRLSAREIGKAYLLLGLSYERTRQLDKALGVFQLGARLFPKDINLLTELGALLHRSGLEQQARPLFERVLQIHPNNAAAHLGMAEIDRSLGLLDESTAHYEKTLETQGDVAAIWRDYAEVLLQQRETKTAELAIRRALELSPDPDSVVDLALIQRQAGRLDEALATLDSLLAKGGTRGDVALTRALWLIEAGREREALAGAESVLRASPDDPLGRWIRARVELKEDRYTAAVRDLEAAAQAGRQAPFVARVSAAMLAGLKARPSR